MEQQFTVQIDAWAHGTAIPARFAFGRPGTDSPFAPSDNVSPAIHWSHAPAGTKSFAIICHDPDVPSSGDDVNQAGKMVPADLPRIDFFHWVLVDIPANRSGLDEGAASHGLTPRGKSVGQTEHGMTGKNDYTGWFAGDPEMAGIYGSYDGPCPPWNDSILHHYYFEVFALDVETLGCQGEFTGQEALKAIEGHILARSAYMGTYSMNPAIAA
ncbi:MAG: YbhB/YbcL family Raf kinase inhibitor-like protein [Cyanobacteria bacterium P01_H01_bin.121]